MRFNSRRLSSSRVMGPPPFTTRTSDAATYLSRSEPFRSYTVLTWQSWKRFSITMKSMTPSLPMAEERPLA